MKVRSLAAVILFAGTVAFAQKPAPLVIKHHAARAPLAKSESPDVVAAALNKRKSSTASDLAVIERSSAVHARGKTSSAAKGVYVPNNVTAYKNKPMHASNSTGNGGKHTPAVRKRTGKVG